MWGNFQAVAPHAYALDPSGAAVPLTYQGSAVYTGGIPVPEAAGVLVTAAVAEILDGEDAGKKCETGSTGGCTFDFLHLNAPFTARASKPG
jgi:hypothetical protein